MDKTALYFIIYTMVKSKVEMYTACRLNTQKGHQTPRGLARLGTVAVGWQFFPEKTFRLKHEAQQQDEGRREGEPGRRTIMNMKMNYQFLWVHTNEQRQDAIQEYLEAR